ncbi:MAG: DOPA 4,5-dioxygenase family protein [Deltaproteobacteria bacterium]|nr:DOPA 4,5-dioxygenase family protein [Deltaproteobacteria bacterium]
MDFRYFHAHIYFEPHTREAALGVQKEVAAGFPVAVSHLIDAPIGPHPLPMFEVDFGPREFGAVVPWLMSNRRGLSVLVHPRSGDDLRDHTEHALWLGPVLPLRLEVLGG